ncbi:hypothetical protein ACNVED_13680 [Legionella sp. D16C41]|uniref:hypothetical protein n=1 Tax=Legionella sp. D16C41 TaxID=3402688 RepID=UPI003AF6796B
MATQVKAISYGNSNLNLAISTSNGIFIVGSGNDKITVAGSSNILTVGDGTDTISVSGDNNLLTVGNGNDSINLLGKNEALVIGNGNNVINALSTSGTDAIVAGSGNNLVNLGYVNIANSIVQFSAANFALTLGNGINNIKALTTGTSVIKFGSNSNTVDAGVGSSLVTGGGGPNLMIYEANLNAIAHGGSSIYIDGKGISTLEIRVSYGQLNSAAFQSNITAFKAAVASGAEQKALFTFSSIPLSVQGLENLKITAQDLGTPVASFTAMPAPVKESSPGAQLGTLSATDIDALDQHYWLILNNGANTTAKYVIGGESTQVINGLTWFNGVNGPETLKLAGGAVLDDATPSNLPITVAIADIAQLQAIKAGTLQVGALATQTYNIAVTPVPQPPTSLTVTSPGGDENTPISLNIHATTLYAGDILTYQILGVPAGGSLSAGTRNADGSWSLTNQQLNGLTFNSGWNQSSGSVELNVIATSTQPNGLATSLNQVIDVAVKPVAQAPIVSISAAPSGDAGSDIPLNISARLPDGDSVDTLTSVTIRNVPADATIKDATGRALTAAADGSYTLTPDQLTGLTLSLGAAGQLASAATLNLAVSANTRVADSVTTATANHTLTINPVALAPVVSISATPSGDAGSDIPLNISARLADGDKVDTLTSVTIRNVPADATIKDATGRALTAAADGSYTLTPDQLTGLTLSLGAAGQLASAATLNLAVSANTRVADSVATATTGRTLTINPVALAPVVSISATPSGDAGSAIPLNISARLADGDKVDTLTSVTIRNVPADATIKDATGRALTAAADGSYTLTPDQLTGLTLSLGAAGQLASAATLDLAVSANTRVADSVATATTGRTLTINPVALAPVVSISATPSGDAGSAIPLNISARLADGDKVDTLTSVTIRNVPADATIKDATGRALTAAADGSYTLTPDQLTGLTLSLGAAGQLASAATLDLAVSANTRVADSVATATTGRTLTINPVALAPVVSISATPSGDAGSAIPLNISARLADGDKVDTLTSVTIRNVPADATIKDATGRALTAEADGSYKLTPDQLTGLTLSLGAAGQLATAATLNLAVSANTQVANSVTTATAGHTLTINPVALAPVVSISATPVGDAGSAIPLNISARLADGDKVDTLTSVTIRNVPADATIKDATGRALTAEADGSYKLTPDQLTGLTLSLGAAGQLATAATLNLAVSANTQVANSVTTATAGHTLTINPVAVAPVVSISALLSSDAGSEVALNINARLADGDRADTLTSVTLRNVPADATIKDATGRALPAAADGSYTLTPDQLTGLTLSLGAGQLASAATLDLAVSANTRVADSVATATASHRLTINPAARAPIVAVSPVSGDTSAPIPLNIGASLPSGDTVDTLSSVTVANVPTGDTLQANGVALIRNTDGTYTVSPEQLSSLSLITGGPRATVENFDLLITAKSSIASSIASATARQTVTINPLTVTGGVSVGGDTTTGGAAVSTGGTGTGTTTGDATAATGGPRTGVATGGTGVSAGSDTTTGGAAVATGGTGTGTTTGDATAATGGPRTGVATGGTTVSAGTDTSATAGTAVSTGVAIAAGHDTSTGTTATASGVAVSASSDISSGVLKVSSIAGLTASGVIDLSQLNNQVNTNIAVSSAPINAIDLSPQANNILNVSAASVLSVTGVDHTLTVTGAGDNVQITDPQNWQNAGTIVQNGEAYTEYTSIAAVSGQAAATLLLHGTYTDTGVGGVTINHTLT